MPDDRTPSEKVASDPSFLVALEAIVRHAAGGDGVATILIVADPRQHCLVSNMADKDSMLKILERCVEQAKRDPDQVLSPKRSLQ